MSAASRDVSWAHARGASRAKTKGLVEKRILIVDLVEWRIWYWLEGMRIRGVFVGGMGMGDGRNGMVWFKKKERTRAKKPPTKRTNSPSLA